MKYILLFATLLPTIMHAQVTHSVGVGTFINYAKPVNISQPLDSLGITQDVTGRVSLSPFIEYTLAIKRFNASLGIGYWQNATKTNTNFSLGFFSYSVESKTRDHSLFFPVSIGYDLVHSTHLHVGVKARTNFRYLMSISNEISTPFGSFNSTTSGSDLDTLDVTRFFVSPGLGVYGGYDIGRFTPSLELGALYDLQGATKTGSDENKYLNLYAAVAVRFRLCGVKNEDGATR